MIKFRCSKCNQKIAMTDAAVGKKVRCPQCSSVEYVPQMEIESEYQEITVSNPKNINQRSFSNRTEHESSATFLGLPKVIIVLIGVSLICIILVIAGWRLSRDTWEIDNLLKIKQMITEAREQCSLEKYNYGIQKYEELCVFIGNRELTYERQRLDYIDVREKYESLKERMRAEKKRQAELAILEMERKIAEEKAKQEAEIARKKEIEEREKAEAQIIEAKKPSIFASESKQKKIANQQEKNRLDEERILKGYLYDREMADSLISNLLNDGAITQASFVSSNILPKFYSYNHHKSIYPTYAEFVYYVEYWTQGGLYRKGQCDIALDAVILPDNVRIKYNIPVAWKVRYIYIDGVNIWGFN